MTSAFFRVKKQIRNIALAGLFLTSYVVASRLFRLQGPSPNSLSVCGPRGFINVASNNLNVALTFRR
jgi:hypothetical protein